MRVKGENKRFLGVSADFISVEYWHD
uniref:Uncharacterized protein n=1 Tax=Arundo donax TaxID=35708 RepID=A0A0A9B513_ARUDO